METFEKNFQFTSKTNVIQMPQSNRGQEEKQKIKTIYKEQNY